jgi:hypothetical protein
MNTQIKEPELLINDAHGIYIPQLFCQTYINYIVNKEELKEDIETCLKGPEEEYYFDAWDNIEMNCKFTNDRNEPYYIGNLYESGDLWAIPEGYEYED